MLVWFHEQNYSSRMICSAQKLEHISTGVLEYEISAILNSLCTGVMNEARRNNLEKNEVNNHQNRTHDKHELFISLS